MVEVSASATVDTNTSFTANLEDDFRSRFGIWVFGVIRSYRTAGIPNASTGRAYLGQKTGRCVA